MHKLLKFFNIIYIFICTFLSLKRFFVTWSYGTGTPKGNSNRPSSQVQGVCVSLPGHSLVWAPMQSMALSEVKGTWLCFSFYRLAYLIKWLSFKILPVSWCGTGKIKACPTNRLNKLTRFIIDWLRVKPLSLYLCPEVGHGLRFRKRTILTEDCGCWPFPLGISSRIS